MTITAQLRDALQPLIRAQVPYQPGGRTRAGCDCYGLIVMAYAALGIALPVTAHEAASLFASVVAPWRTGDILCVTAGWTLGVPHLGIVVDQTTGYHCSLATNGVATFRPTARLWRRGVQGWRYRETPVCG